MLNEIKSFFLILFFIFIYYFLVAPSTEALPLLNVYQGRDLYRAVELIFNSRFILYGPELTGGGNLPGPAYYFLISIPLILFKSLVASYYFPYFLAAIAATILFCFLKKKYTADVGLLAVLMFLSSPIFKYEIDHFWNPSYLFIFIVSLLVLFWSEILSWKLFFGGLLLGVSFQVHFSMLILAIPILVVLMTAQNVNFKKKLKNILIFTLGVLLFNLPFYFSKLLKFSSDVNLNLAGSSLLFKRIEFLFQNEFHKLLGSHNYNWLLQLMTDEYYFFMGICAAFLLPFGYIKQQSKFLFYALIITAFEIIFIFSEHHLIRYLLPLFVLYICCSALWIFIAASQIKQFKNVVIGVLIVFLTIQLNNNDLNELLTKAMANLLFVLLFLGLNVFLFYFFNIKSKGLMLAMAFPLLLSVSQREVIPKFDLNLHEVKTDFIKEKISILVAEKIVKNVFEVTRWPLEYFIKHTLLPFYNDQDFAFLYFYHSRESLFNEPNTFDGLLINNLSNSSAVVTINSEHFFNEKVIESVYPFNIINAVKNKAIKIVKVQNVDNFELIYYNFSHPFFKPNWTNIANLYYGFLFDREDATEGKQVVNHCESDLAGDCEIAISLKKIDAKSIALSIRGKPLAIHDMRANPKLALRIVNPRLKIYCADKTVKELLVASLLGFSGGGALLTPFDELFALPCVPKQIDFVALNGDSYVGGLARSRNNKLTNPIELSWFF